MIKKEMIKAIQQHEAELLGKKMKLQLVLEQNGVV